MVIHMNQNQIQTLTEKLNQGLVWKLFHFFSFLDLLPEVFVPISDMLGIAGKSNNMFLCNVLTEPSPNFYCTWYTGIFMSGIPMTTYESLSHLSQFVFTTKAHFTYKNTVAYIKN